MQATATPLDIIYIGAGKGPTSAGGYRVETVAPGADAWPAGETVDCLLVDTVTAGWGAVELVRRVDRAYPSTPVVAFTEPETAGRVLDAGATDVVRSPPDETPETLLQRRVENVCETTPVAGVAEHGSYTHGGLLEQLSENLQDVVWVNNPDRPPGKEIEFVSAAYEEVWGRPREHLFDGGTEAFYETVHPDDRERIRERNGKGRLAAGDADLTYRIVRPDGEIRWIHDRALDVSADGETSQLVGILRDITDRKHRDQELRASEETLESVLSAVPMALFAFDESGVFTRSQGRVLEQFHLEPGDMVGESLFDVFAHRPDIRKHCTRALDGERVTATVAFSGRTLESQYQPVYDDGDVVRVVGHTYDITDRIEQQHRLARQNDLFTKAQALADVGAWEYRPDGQSVWTEQVYDIHRLPRETTPTLETAKECYHPADWPRVRTALDRAIEHGESFDLEVRLATETDDVRWVHLRGESQDGDGSHIRGTVQDITDRKRREQELERSREFLDQLHQVGDVGGWEYDFESDTLRLTEATCKLLDLPSETTLGAKAILECHHPDDREHARNAVTRLWTEGEPLGIEVRALAGDGEQRWMYSQAEPIYEGGDVVAMRGVTRDITDRKRREQQLQAERDIVERILETSPVGVLVHDDEQRITRANEKAAEVMGVEAGTLEGRQTPPEGLQILSAAGEPRSDQEMTVIRAKETGEPVRDVELVIETQDGERRNVVVGAVPLYEDGELHRIVATLEDVTERVEREQQLETQRNELAQLDRINRIIRDVDAALVAAESRAEVEQAVCEELAGSGPYHRALLFQQNGDRLSLNSTLGVDESGDVSSPEIPRSAPTWRAVETGETQATRGEDTDEEWAVCQQFLNGECPSAAAIPLTDEGQTHGVLVVCSARAEALHERELAVLDELGRNVGHAIGAVERREREATLTSLYEATQGLLTAEGTEEVSETVVETASSVLDPSGVGIFLFDHDENVLQPAACTERLREFYDGPMTFGPGKPDSIPWQTYADGEQQFFRDVRTSPHLSNPETEARTAMFLPLGDHGVFVVATDERVPFGEEKQRLVGLLGATTEAALDRVAGRAELRERDRRLEKRSTRLEHLERLFSLVGDIDDALRRAGTPEGFEQRVCEKLVDTDPFEFAWVGAIPPDGSAVTPRTWADGERSEQTYLDEVSFTLDSETPAARAADSGQSVAIPNVTDHLREADWARTAVEHGYESVLVVPLAHEDATYGVLAAYATEPDAFDGPARTVFDRLGTLVPQVNTGLQRDRTVLADRVVELELSLPNPESFPNAVAATVGKPVAYRQVKPMSGGRTRIVFSLSDPPTEGLREVERQFVSVESLDMVEHAGRTSVRATVSGSTVAARVLSCGALPDEIVARTDRTSATVRLPRDADVRLFLERVAEHYPGVELVSRRDVGPGDETEAVAQRALAEDLTDRQREVLRTAYEHGFFESPRSTTGVELADLLGVSQPTVTHHLREAQRRLFDALFESV